MANTIEVRLYVGDDIESYEVLPDRPVVVRSDPYFHEKLGWFVPEYDRPATLYVYTNDSVREPHPADTSEWNGPAERGLTFRKDIEPPDEPFWGEWWGRVMFYATPGGRR